MKLKIIDGTHSEGPAPRPKRGLVLALYETLEALGKPSDVEAVRKLLPAAISDSSQIASKAKLLKRLENGAYYGYFQKVGDEHYKIASKEYFEARQQQMAKQREEYLARGGRRLASNKTPVEDTIVRVYHLDWVMFFAGLLTGLTGGVGAYALALRFFV